MTEDRFSYGSPRRSKTSTGSASVPLFMLARFQIKRERWKVGGIPRMCGFAMIEALLQSFSDFGVVRDCPEVSCWGPSPLKRGSRQPGQPAGK